MKTCDRCNGTGETASTELYRGRRVSTWCRCTGCQGTGTVEAPDQPEPPSEAATVLVVGPVAQVETRTEAMQRLLEVARESGVKLGRDEHGEYWATSISEPGRLYRVEPESCGCRGFRSHRRCRHVAALWAHLGYLDVPELEPSGRVTIHHSDGHDWHEPITTIALDGVEKVRVTGETHELRVAWLEDGRPVDDLTGCTPSFLDHYGAVRNWIESLIGDTADVLPAMQAAGLFAREEVYDDLPVAA